MDVSKLWSPVFDISAPPTSSECTVFVISCAGKSAVEISICRRGESAWTTKVYRSNSGLFGPVVNSVFVKGVWYCLHDAGNISVVDVGNCEWRDLDLPKGLRQCDYATIVSYVMKQGDQVRLYIHVGVGYEIALKEPLRVNERGGALWLGDAEFLLRSSLKGAILQLQDQLKVDSFNIHAWCGTCDSENGMTFHWHNFRSFVDNYYCLNAGNCPRDNCTIVAWFEPAWVHCSPNLDWT